MQHLMPATYHVPVMLSESLDPLVLDPGGVYIDLTFGGGGHSSGILQKLNNNGQLYAFDQDPDAKANILQFEGDSRFHFIDSNFRFFRKYLRMHGISEISGILADLGISSHQIDLPERGFSTRFNSVLDMRMNLDGEKTARSIINEYDEAALQHMFSEYGEIRNAKTLARTIISGRINNQISTAEQLNEVCKTIAPRQKLNKYLAQVYQALRIEVNSEIEVLGEMILESFSILKPGGRISIISYHSLEDRIVKNMFNYGNSSGEANKDFYGNLIRPLKPVNRKPIIPSEQEIKKNPRSRSAKLRIAEKIQNNE